VKWVHDAAAFDEAFDRDGQARAHYRGIVATLESFTQDEVSRRERLQRLALVDQGITFTVYGEKEGLERIFPFDFVPRIVTAREWEGLEAGLVQRVTALNLFIADVYGEQTSLRDNVLPPALLLSRREYKRELLGVRPSHGVYTHVVGTDIIRDDRGEFLVLEDNCRCPSGVSYVLENRNLMTRVFPELFGPYPVRPIKDYPNLLLDALLHAAPRAAENPVVVVLSPGIHNSAFFEHSFLAREMGTTLVEGRDLVVEDNHVYMRTTQGRQRVDVVYRRIDEDFLDPLVFRRDSLLGVPGLLNAYREGNVAIANAPGAGVADDKAIYAFMPQLIKYYLGEDARLGQVPTYVGFRREDFAFMREHAAELVIKTTGDSGGYNMLMGPFATRAEVDAYVTRMRRDPTNYVAQPLIHLSTHPTYVDGRFEPRRIDLRPFILYGDTVRVLPGGLTRVALRPGSYVVNSSQGGGSKDTWVLAPRRGG
jgi:uncharacterized circularly permuted ATP-grasp superfamily protein